MRAPKKKKNQLTRWLRILCIFSFILRQFDHVMLFSLMCCVFCGDCISKYWGKKATQKNEKRKWKKKKLREWLCLHLTPMVSVAYLSPMEKVTKKNIYSRTYMLNWEPYSSTTTLLRCELCESSFDDVKACCNLIECLCIRKKTRKNS